MRMKPESKRVRVTIGGNRFVPGTATPAALVRRGLLSDRQAEGADIHHIGAKLSSFTAGRFRVSVDPARFDIASGRPPYRLLRDLALGTLDAMPDRLMTWVRIDRAFHLPMRNPGRFLASLADRGWISGLGSFLCAVDFQPEKPEGGCLWVFAGHSALLASTGRPGIRIEVSDRYLGGRDRDRSNRLVSAILEQLFHESVRQSDDMVDRILADRR